MTRFFSAAGGLLACIASASVPAQGLDFHSSLRAAQARAPMLAARAASVQGAAELQVSAGQLPDPKLTLGIDSLPVSGPNRGSLTRDDFTQRQIGFMQDVPNRAKRAARASVALARTERERAQLKTETLSIRREAGLAWIARHHAEKRLALFDTVLGHHRKLVDTSAAQVAAGNINPVDVTMAKLEALALTDRRDELRRELEQSRATFKRWLGPVDDTPLTGDLPALVVDGAYLRANLERIPDIAALAPLQAMAEAEVREAEAATVGDWSWNVGYGKRGSGYGDLVSVQFTFELPLSQGERQLPQIRARQKELERLAAEREEILRRQLQELDMLLAEESELSTKLTRLTTDTQALAAQRSALTLAAYESGRDKLSAVYEARKQQAELDLRALDMQAKLRAVQWRLNTLIGE